MQEFTKVKSDKIGKKVKKDMERRYNEYLKEMNLAKSDGSESLTDE